MDFGIGEAIGGLLGFFGQERTNAMNDHINQRAMRWQEQMRATAYQATMKDMRKAGLNPILAASRGATNWGTPQSIPMQNPMASASQAFATAADVALKQKQADVAIQEAEKKAQEVVSEKIKNGRIVLQNMSTGEFVDGLMQNQIAREAAMAKYYGNLAELDEILLDFYNSAEALKIAKDLGVSPNTIKGIFQAIFGSKVKHVK